MHIILFSWIIRKPKMTSLQNIPEPIFFKIPWWRIKFIYISVVYILSESNCEHYRMPFLDSEKAA